MTKMETIREILGHRIDGEPVVSGKWLVWRCTKSYSTMQKFIGRVNDEGVACFFRDGKFGVLRSDVETESAAAAADLAAEFR